MHGDRLDLGRIAAVPAQRLGEGSEGLCPAPSTMRSKLQFSAPSKLVTQRCPRRTLVVWFCCLMVLLIPAEASWAIT